MMKKAVGVLLVAGMLTGLFGNGVAMAEPVSPGLPMDPNPLISEQVLPTDESGLGMENGQERGKKLKVLKEQMPDKIEKLKELREETRQLAGDLKERRDTLKPLIDQARENGDKETLAKLEPIRVESRALVEATHKLRAEKSQLWQEFGKAVASGELQRAEAIFDQILWHKQAINANLKLLINLADKSIDILQ